MLKNSLPSKTIEIALLDAVRRDLTTARRTALLELIWNERFLSRTQLISRIEYRLGKYCFGKSAWKDNFYRDMRLVKQAFHAAGFQLSFSRGKMRGGYYLLDQPSLGMELKQIIKSSSAEVDIRQIEIYSQLSAAERFRQGCVISDTARNVVAYRIQQEKPGISLEEASRLALRKAYT